MLKNYEPVCYELLRPGQVKARREACPIAYVPAGALEWHSFHNPLGTDGLKAHTVCCEAALHAGGVVLPPVHQGYHSAGNWGPVGWENYTLGQCDIESLGALYRCIMRGLVVAGYLVLVGVTGHDTHPQRDVLRMAIGEATRGTGAAGFAVMEGELLPEGDDLGLRMDHAAAWETSVMMYAYPESVDLDQLRCSGYPMPEAIDSMPGPLGITGLSPLRHASAELGQRIVERLGQLIGDRARETLVAEHRACHSGEEDLS